MMNVALIVVSNNPQWRSPGSLLRSLLASASEMCMVSLTSKVELCLAWSRMDVLSQVGQWCSFQACSAMADRLFPLILLLLGAL